MIVFCHVPWLAEWSNQPVCTCLDLKGLGGWNEEAWNVRTWERANAGAGARGWGRQSIERDRIRLFVLHSLTARMVRAQGTWEHATVIPIIS